MGRTVMAAVTGVVVFLAVSFVFYELLMKEQFAVWEADVARAEPLLWMGLLGMLLLMLTMSYLYPIISSGGNPLMEGGKLGLIVGAVLASVMLIVGSVYAVALGGTLTDIVFNVALLVLVGAIIGKVHSMGAPEVGA